MSKPVAFKFSLTFDKFWFRGVRKCLSGDMKKCRLQITVCTWKLYGHNCSINRYVVIPVIFPIGNNICNRVYLCGVRHYRNNFTKMSAAREYYCTGLALDYDCHVKSNFIITIIDADNIPYNLDFGDFVRNRNNWNRFITKRHKRFISWCFAATKEGNVFTSIKKWQFLNFVYDFDSTAGCIDAKVSVDLVVSFPIILRSKSTILPDSVAYTIFNPP